MPRKHVPTNRTVEVLTVGRWFKHSFMSLKEGHLFRLFEEDGSPVDSGEISVALADATLISATDGAATIGAIECAPAGRPPTIREWDGLHGPVTFMGGLLYADDPAVMRAYWNGFCGEDFAKFNMEFPELVGSNAMRVCEGDADGFEFVYMDGTLRGWQTHEDKSPSVENLRDVMGKAVALYWMEVGEAEALGAAA